jgi:hypothetical protein
LIALTPGGLIFCVAYWFDGKHINVHDNNVVNKDNQVSNDKQQ